MEQAPTRSHVVQVPSWLFERMAACYYGVGPRFHADEPLPRLREPEVNPKTQGKQLVKPPTIPPNLQSLPPTITGLVGGGRLIPRGVGAPKAAPPPPTNPQG